MDGLKKMSDVESLKNQAKNIEILPSKMPIEGYVRAKFRCICCKKKFFLEGELRKEDVDKLIKKDIKPLCRSCAIQNQKHIDKYNKLEGGLEATQKLCNRLKQKYRGYEYAQVRIAIDEILAVLLKEGRG